MKFIPNSLTRQVARQVLVAKKNSPHIFFGAGVIGVVGSTFLACKATLKLEETLDDIHEEIKEVKSPSLAHSQVMDAPTESDYYKDLGYVYGKSVIRIGKLYGPAVIVGTISIGALTGSHVQLTRRNTALTATLAAVSKAYDDYRVRVQEEIGEEREIAIHRAMYNEEGEDENGKKIVRQVTDPNGWSIYARLFDEKNSNFVKNAEYNRIFIQAQQNYFNDRLQAYGYVFLNDVYEALGFERSKAGCIVGWVLDGDGDGYVDFGMHEARAKEFLNGYEPRVVLDFNVDGVVYDCLADNEF